MKKGFVKAVIFLSFVFISSCAYIFPPTIYEKVGQGPGNINNPGNTLYPSVSIVSGPTTSSTNNSEFNVSLSVTRNYGYYSTNGSTFVQFPTGTLRDIVVLDGVTTLRYYGYDGTFTSITNTIVYTVIAPKIKDYPQVASINYNYDWANPVNYNNTIYFGGFDLSTIQKSFYLTSGGAVEVNNNSATYNFIYSNPIVCNDRLIFLGRHTSSVDYIYKIESDKIFDVMDGGFGYDRDFLNPVIMNNAVYFQGNISGMPRIIRYSYSSDSLEQIPVDGGTDYASYFRFGAVAGGKIYFEGLNGTFYKVYCYDGSKVVSVDQFNPSYNQEFQNSIACGNYVFFKGVWNGFSGILYVNATDDTIHAPNIATTEYMTNIDTVFHAGQNLLFRGIASSGYSKVFLIYTAGSSGIQIESVPVSPVCDYHHNFSNPIALGNSVFFEGMNATLTSKIYEYDSVSNIIRNVNPGNSGYSQLFNSPAVVGQWLYFWSNNTCYKYSQSVKQIVEVKKGAGCTFNNGPQSPATNWNTLIFGGNDGGGVIRIYMLQ